MASSSTETFLLESFPFKEKAPSNPDMRMEIYTQVGPQFCEGLQLRYKFSQTMVESREYNSPLRTWTTVENTILHFSLANMASVQGVQRGVQVALLFHHAVDGYYLRQPLSWVKCPALGHSVRFLPFTLKSGSPIPTHIHLHIKSPKMKLIAKPFTKLPEISFIGRSLTALSPNDTVFILFNRPPSSAEDTGAISQCLPAEAYYRRP